MESLYYVWSNEHRAWWKPGRLGYARGLSSAGQYTREDALEICRDAIPSAGHVGAISEIPVRVDDVQQFLAGQLCPGCIFDGER